nr:hypothetical protein BaRGS_031358 [Batillaria attramentaria]
MEADAVEQVGAISDDGHQSEEAILPGADGDPVPADEESDDKKHDSSEPEREGSTSSYTPAESMDVMTESGIEMEPSDDEDIGDTSHLDAEERNQLFARGLMREKEGKMDEELHLIQESGDAPARTTDARTVETLRAEEYEHLAKLCMDKSQTDAQYMYNAKIEESISRHLLAVLLFICFLCLAMLGLGLYCRYFNMSACDSVISFIHDAYIQLRFQYYKYTSTKHVKFA